MSDFSQVPDRGAGASSPHLASFPEWLPPYWINGLVHLRCTPVCMPHHEFNHKLAGLFANIPSHLAYIQGSDAAIIIVQTPLYIQLKFLSIERK